LSASRVEDHPLSHVSSPGQTTGPEPAVAAAGRPPGIATILPHGVASAEAIGDPRDGPVLPEEAEAISSAQEKRRRDFATGRSLARRALERLGRPPVAIPRGPRGEPVWPPGIVGSITHCPRYCAAAVAESHAAAAIGIDAEVDRALPPGVLRLIADSEERQWIDARVGDGVHWDRLLFSAKESVYKVWFPIMGRRLPFDAVRIAFSPEAASFRATFLAERAVLGGERLDGVDGRYLRLAAHVLTAVAIRGR
jgi:4'-phosphopantetheinyl transferase EntD